ncbi:MAG: hypothetical protein WC824_15450, partial [Bacteroidota bacterium]
MISIFPLYPFPLLGTFVLGGYFPMVKHMEYHGGPIRLTPKEIERESSGVTIIVRPQAEGGFLVAPVQVSTGRVFGAPSGMYSLA